MPKLLYFCMLILLIKPGSSQQHYDNSNCASEMQYPGSNYICNAKKTSCETFIVYRAQENYQTFSSISSLFNTDASRLLLYNNNMFQTNPNNLQPGREIIVPVTCSCPDPFSEAFFLYNASTSDSLSAVACEVFEGLVKAQTLIDKNQELQNEGQNFSPIQVPVKCACPNSFDAGNGVNFLVTYPVLRTDNIDTIAQKFRVPPQMISNANRLQYLETIYPQTTLLIPTKDVPNLNLDVLSSPPDPNSSPQPKVPLDNGIPGDKLKKEKIILGVLIFGTVSLILILAGVLILAREKFNHWRSNTPSSQVTKFSDLSPEFQDDLLNFKLSLTCYSLEELRVATYDFNEALAIGLSVYRGRLGNTDMAIEQVNSTEIANHVISILTKINHVNVVKLDGCCLGSRPYLVYELIENGCLSDCLSSSTIAKQLTWDKRIQIAFDIAVGLHYIHYCTVPSYVHQNINSKSILITANLRAKISGFRLARSRNCSEEKKDTAVDVYAFGMILLELLSGKQVTANGLSLKEFLKVLGDKELQETYQETLKTFIDPVMEDEHPLEGALFLACLAKACLEEDPLARPSTNDILKALSSTL